MKLIIVPIIFSNFLTNWAKFESVLFELHIIFQFFQFLYQHLMLITSSFVMLLELLLLLFNVCLTTNWFWLLIFCIPTKLNVLLPPLFCSHFIFLIILRDVSQFYYLLRQHCLIFLWFIIPFFWNCSSFISFGEVLSSESKFLFLSS